MPSGTQDWSGPAVPATVALLRNALAEFAAAEGLSGLGLADLRICVSEAVTNAVVHAYRDGRARGTVSITAERQAGELLVTVHDDGMGFSPRADSPGGGRGLAVIVALSSTLSIDTSPGGGTALSMAFPMS